MSPFNPLAVLWYSSWRALAVLLPRRWTSRIMTIAVRPWIPKGWRLASGKSCMYCGFFSSLNEDDSEGICRKFCVQRRRDAMGLLRRRRGEFSTPDALPLIVGGGFWCGDFRSKFNPPAANDPLGLFWAQAVDPSRDHPSRGERK